MNRWVVISFCLIGLSAAAPNDHFLRSDPTTSLHPVNIQEDAYLDVIPLIRKYGYPAEDHTVITADGYVLGVHRIPHGRDQNNNPSVDRPTVLLMHGLMSSSADWVIMGPSMGLGYILAETGYDVWMGNARGNYYSRKHISLSPNGSSRREFWDFSWHEIGMRDVPAIIDYILSVTGKSSIHYIGHSQGTTAFFVMASSLPAYNNKVKAVQALAPVAYMEHVLSPLYRTLAPLSSPLQIVTTLLGMNEFLPNSQILTWAGRYICYERSIITALCENLVFLIAGSNSDNLNATLVPIIMGHTPAGASSKQFAHYGQLVNSAKFEQWDFGNIRNLIEYGRWNPPSYPLERISTPVALHYSAYDLNTEIRDVKRLHHQLGNSLGIFEVPVPGFSHVDFIWSMQARSLVYDPMIALMQSYD